MLIQRANGCRAEAILLALNKNQMRVMIAGESDAVELTILNGCWVDEYGDTIELEALMPLEGVGWQYLCNELYPRTMAAGTVLA
jgi:hypothetical protein